MRKSLILTCLGVLLLVIAVGAFAAPTTLAISIRTLSSPYQVMYKNGAEAYAKIVGLPLDVLTTEANSEKGLTDIKAEIARTGGNVAFYVDPNDASDAVSIAKTMEAARSILGVLVEQAGGREGLELPALDLPCHLRRVSRGSVHCQ